VRAAGVPRLTPHGLRHTNATLLILAGVPLKVVSERLGHASVAITADVYAHVTVEADRSAADRIAELLADSA
ncbi:MAG: tyrosine-type recombinase/integrase, partial [Chloroflexota bacterium]|nr:tyrosine-type recombinase/integrase [Chloroflexota bacterium]